MYCKNCGTQIEDGVNFCSACGASAEPSNQDVIPTQPHVSNSRPCPKCKGGNVQFQTVTESKSTGCITVLVYIFLAITILGWLILIPLLLRKKTRTVTYGICQSCGHRWRV